MLDGFRKFNEMLGSLAEWVAFGAIFLMVALTCVDVVGAKLFLSPVFGSLDIMMMAQLIAIALAATMTLIRNRHVQVEFFMLLFPKRVQALVDCLMQLLCLALFSLIVWRLFTHGYHLQAGAEETPTARIPMAPFSYAAALGTIPVCLVLLEQFFFSILRVMKNES
jgi:TRAP-type C4-dicarboxylate transport system permease small subunit